MRRVLILALVLLGSLLLAPQAGAFIYWSSYNSGNSTVGRADLDGHNANPAIVSGIYFGGGVATDGSHIYWGESGSNPKMAAIGRADPDGGNPDHAYLNGSTYCGIFGMRATATDLFWLHSTCSSGTNTIERHSSMGYTYAGAGNPGKYTCGFDFDANYIYWSERQYIARAPINGGPADQTWLDLGAGNEACGVAVDAAHVYWTYSLPKDGANFAHQIGRANINGDEGSIDPAFLGGTFLGGTGAGSADIVVQGDFIYWTNQGPGAVGSIGRASLNGTGVDQNFISGVQFPTGLAVDSGGPPPAPPCTTCNTIPPPQVFPVFIGSGSSNSSFAVGRASTPVRGRPAANERSARRDDPPVGTTFFYELDQAADMTIEMKRKKAGRVAKGKCAKPSKKNKKGKKCDLTVAKLYRSAVAGRNELPFTGRVNGKAFAPGKYFAVFTATGVSGKSTTATIPFRIVPSK